MPKQNRIFRLVTVSLLMIFLHSVMLPVIVLGQATDCQFDRSKPSLDNARKNFLALNYDCAEEEINALLNSEGLNTQIKADAHVLLAEVYYAKVRNDSEKKEKVVEQFVAAFKAYRDWRGELNITSPEFMNMMKEAQDMVDQGKTEPEEVKIEVPEEETPKQPTEKKKGAWYKQWWAIGLGVGVVVGGVILIASGGSEDTSADTLASFPPPPTSKK
jgi:hypothetical protein